MAFSANNIGDAFAMNLANLDPAGVERRQLWQKLLLQIAPSISTLPKKASIQERLALAREDAKRELASLKQGFSLALLEARQSGDLTKVKMLQKELGDREKALKMLDDQLYGEEKRGLLRSRTRLTSAQAETEEAELPYVAGLAEAEIGRRKAQTSASEAMATQRATRAKALLNPQDAFFKTYLQGTNDVEYFYNIDAKVNLASALAPLADSPEKVGVVLSVVEQIKSENPQMDLTGLLRSIPKKVFQEYLNEQQ